MRVINLLILVFITIGCSSNKVIVNDSLIEESSLDTLVVSAPAIKKEDQKLSDSLDVYHGSYNRVNDLLHTKLEIAFNWEEEKVIGKAHLDLTPVYYPTDELTLHAIGFKINSISNSKGGTLSYTYDGKEIVVDLGKEYKKGQKYSISIDYTASPSASEDGGSSAITSDKGLFFINPRGEDIYKPQQIWTQGETENNSRWFPTIDKPNEKTTQEIFITVQDRFKTLSNGLLVNSTDNKDGTRTDHWKQSLAHTPYLFMIAVGEYSVVKDKWKGKEVSYYVESEYEDDARSIFNHTPEMINFFSELLDYPYPWEKYSQIVVRDFVSGAMENTTASVYGDFVQKTTQELIDNHNDHIVAHELFHHWFGDLVTCENWANLTLNEGFANYSEYLWQEYKYGKDAAEHHRFDEMKTYLESSLNKTHPLIHYGYENEEDMFDAHSYNKGGLVLHMLRHILGNDAFFDSLNKYLVDNEFSTVEVAELRLAFEETTGQDLSWYFDQWYMDAGHPILEVDYKFDFKSNQLNIQVNQIQEDYDHKYIYQLPVEVAVYDKQGNVSYYPIVINKRSQAFSFKLDAEPSVTVLDGKRYLLADINEVFSTSQLKALYNYSPNFIDKKLSLTRLRNNDRAAEIFEKALEDEYSHFRKLALNYRYLEIADETLEKMIMSDDYSRNRRDALKLLGRNNLPKAAELASEILETENTIPVLSQAIKVIYKHDETKGLAEAERLYTNNARSMAMTLLDLFAKGNDPKYLPYLNAALIESDIYKFFPISNNHFTLASSCTHENILIAAEALHSISMKKDENSYKKFISTSNIQKLRDLLAQRIIEDAPSNVAEISKTIQNLDDFVREIIENEEDDSLLEKYRTNIGT